MSVPLATDTLPVVQQFSEQLHHTIFMTRLSSDGIVGNLILQFDDGIIASHADAFEPMLTAWADDESVVYMEMKDVL